MIDIKMPPEFPSAFSELGAASAPFFSRNLWEAMNDPLQKRANFMWSWQAVRYRYRTAYECADEFKKLILAPRLELTEALKAQEEEIYRFERLISQFFMAGLAVFDSSLFCLYFLGDGVCPGKFELVKKPRKIDRQETISAYNVAFPRTPLATFLGGLEAEAGLRSIAEWRNVLVHRVAGRPGVSSSTTIHDDCSHTTDFVEETWGALGVTAAEEFSESFLQKHLDYITQTITILSSKALEFAVSHAPQRA